LVRIAEGGIAERFDKIEKTGKKPAPDTAIQDRLINH
jgi:hypothetical protein